MATGTSPPIWTVIRVTPIQRAPTIKLESRKGWLFITLEFKIEKTPVVMKPTNVLTISVTECSCLKLWF